MDRSLGLVPAAPPPDEVRVAPLEHHGDGHRRGAGAAWLRRLANLVTGVRVRAEHNRRYIEQTLSKLKAAAEAAHA